MFLKIPQYSQENTCARISFLIKLQTCNYIKKETLTQLFPCEISEIFENIYFEVYLRATVPSSLFLDLNS